MDEENNDGQKPSPDLVAIEGHLAIVVSSCPFLAIISPNLRHIGWSRHSCNDFESRMVLLTEQSDIFPKAPG